MSPSAGPPRDSGRGSTHRESATAVYALLTTMLRQVPREMSLTSLATLATLDRTGPRRITDLAAVEGVAQPSMTTLVTSLERAGLVRRCGDPNDRRVSLIALTPAGLAYVRRRRRLGADTFARLIARLPAGEAAALAAAVPALNHLRELENERRDPGQADAGRGPGAVPAGRGPS